MENCPFIDGLPIKNGDFPVGYVSHNQRVNVFFGQNQVNPSRPVDGFPESAVSLL